MAITSELLVQAALDFLAYSGTDRDRARAAFAALQKAAAFVQQATGQHWIDAAATARIILALRSVQLEPALAPSTRHAPLYWDFAADMRVDQREHAVHDDPAAY